MSTPGPWASIRPARDAARQSARLGQDAAARGGGGSSSRTLDVGELGSWRLKVTSNDELAAEHTATGTVRVLATAHPEEDNQ